jgi:hypothetical protein
MSYFLVRFREHAVIGIPRLAEHLSNCGAKRGIPCRLPSGSGAIRPRTISGSKQGINRVIGWPELSG